MFKLFFLLKHQFRFYFNNEFNKFSIQTDILNFVLAAKQILKEISGEFRGCELTAIVGPSGSGKSTLLNILSGYTTQNVRGSIRVNGEKRNEEKFRKRSTFIMQEENLYGLLTLRETMKFAVRLKMGMRGSAIDNKIMTILETLGLELQVDTFVKNLSGGQQKRLAIAMELVDDPSIVFLDEPTTGLDSSSSRFCISMLKKLAQGGRTIVCTIHQPSALVFEMFDHLYALVDGCCIYQGSTRNLVSFLAEVDLVCPESYNPADYLLEIATDGYGEQNHRLMEKAENGRNETYRESLKLMSDSDISVHECSGEKHSSSFAQQVYQLTSRNMLFNMRDKSFMIVRFAVHCYIGVLVGLMYYKIGDQAKQMINIYKSFLVLVVVLMYTSIYSLLVRCKFYCDVNSFNLIFIAFLIETVHRYLRKILH
jgi:ATP-binding cassette, subfamily G (WHITE), member 1